ncbi:hypothetical protein GCM10011508_05480 [Flavobacterium lutivivi]|nr:hypothetical protein GCM10011508_05480 [Flavobacterium lutivivi]
MKFTFLLFFTLFTTHFNQNDNENFLVENNQVVWQKIYETELSKETLIDKIKTAGKFENINISSDKLTAEIKDLSIDYKGYGESEMSTPMYLSRSFVKAFCMFEFKDKKYRVTFKSIKFVQKYDDALSKMGEITDIENFALSKKNTEFKSGFLKKPSKILNHTFSKVTEFKNDIENNKW